MKSLPDKKRYNIKNIYYSNDVGDIIKSKLHTLEHEELHYTRYYKKIKST